MTDIHVSDLKMPDWIGEKCIITFFAPNGRDEQGNNISLTLSVTIEDGDFKGIIDGIKSDGGVWLPADNGILWFMPWPPAAIRIAQALD